MTEYTIEIEGGEAVVGVGKVNFRGGRGRGGTEPGIYWRDGVTGEPVPMARLIGDDAGVNQLLIERILQRAATPRT